jgi:hypothetical protein
VLVTAAAGLTLTELAAHRAGDCDRGCSYCDEFAALHVALVRLYTARRPDDDAIEAIEARLTAIGDASWIADAARIAEQDTSR